MADPDFSQIPGLEVPLDANMWVVVVLDTGEVRKIRLSQLIAFIGV